MANLKGKQEVKFELTNFNPNSIVDFSEWEKRQQQILDENPFIEVVDRDTWEIGKQRRTALVKARTSLQNERDSVKKELNNAKTFVVNKYDEFIQITTPAEEKQQATVKSFEAELEAEKEKERELEEKRANDIRSRIDTIEGQLDAVVQKMKHDTIAESQEQFDDIVKDGESQEFDEFEFLFKEAVERQRDKFESQAEFVWEQEQKRIDELKVAQQSMVNELYVQANQAIDLMTPETTASTTAKVDEILNTDFDFGEFKEKFEGVANQMFTKLKNRLNDIRIEQDKRQKQEKENELANQRNRIVEIREGLLDLIFQINVDNHNEAKLDIQKKLAKPEKLFPELESEWEKMADRVNQTFEQKFEIINQQLKQREIEKEQEQRAQRERLESRHKQMVELGMEFDKNFETFELTGSGIKISKFNLDTWTDEQFGERVEKIQAVKEENRIENERWDARKPQLEKLGLTVESKDEIDNDILRHEKFDEVFVTNSVTISLIDEDWDDYVDGIKKEIATAKKNDKAEKARQNKIKHDKSSLTEWVNHAVRKHKSQIANLCDNKEMSDFHAQMVDELNAWCDEKVEQIKNL